MWPRSGEMQCNCGKNFSTYLMTLIASDFCPPSGAESMKPWWPQLETDVTNHSSRSQEPFRNNGPSVSCNPRDSFLVFRGKLKCWCGGIVRLYAAEQKTGARRETVRRANRSELADKAEPTARMEIRRNGRNVVINDRVGWGSVSGIISYFMMRGMVAYVLFLPIPSLGG